MILPIILCGGSGTRLWPLSRERFPKQFLPLIDDRTMLQNTVLRLSGLKDAALPLFLCNENHRFIVAEQLRQIHIKPGGIILEPIGRNTAPAAAVAALEAINNHDDPLLLILPSDHVIQDVQAFLKSVQLGAAFAEKGFLITFGIVPTAPETGYGYIRGGKRLKAHNVRGKHIAIYTVDSFEEKPDPETAKDYVASGKYYWNSGMFLFKASEYLNELSVFQPSMVEACKESRARAKSDADFIRLDKHAFTACPKDSIDYAVMEKTDKAAVIPLDAGWSDVGSWTALWEIQEKDTNGNVSKGDVILQDVRNSLLHAGDRLVAAVGVDDLVVIETADAVLIASKEKVQNIKDIVSKLKDQNRHET